MFFLCKCYFYNVCRFFFKDKTFPFQVKCEQYWSSGTKRCDNIIVKATSEITLEDWTLRDFDIKNVSGFHIGFNIVLSIVSVLKINILQ